MSGQIKSFLVLTSISLLVTGCTIRTKGSGGTKRIGTTTVRGEQKIVTQIGCADEINNEISYLERVLADGESLNAQVICYEVETLRNGARGVRSMFFLVEPLAIQESNKKALVVHFGGPGRYGKRVVETALDLHETEPRFRNPVIGFAQPGTNRGSFLPSCSFSQLALSEEFSEDDLRNELTECFEGVTSEDLLPYLTANNPVTDLKALHQVLVEKRGYDPGINFWGFSYGAALALAFDREFPSRIERMLLTGVRQLPTRPHIDRYIHRQASFLRFLSSFTEFCARTPTCSSEAGFGAANFLEDLGLIMAETSSIPIIEDVSINPKEALWLGTQANTISEISLMAGVVHGLANTLRAGSPVTLGENGIAPLVSRGMTAAKRVTSEEDEEFSSLENDTDSLEDEFAARERNLEEDDNRAILERIFDTVAPLAGPGEDVFHLINCIWKGETDVSSLRTLVETYYAEYANYLLPGIESLSEEDFADPACEFVRERIGQSNIDSYLQRLETGPECLDPAYPSYTETLVLLSPYDVRTPPVEGWREAAKLQRRTVFERSCTGHGDLFSPVVEPADLELMLQFFSGAERSSLDGNARCANARINLPPTDGISFSSEDSPPERTEATPEDYSECEEDTRVTAPESETSSQDSDAQGSTDTGHNDMEGAEQDETSETSPTVTQRTPDPVSTPVRSEHDEESEERTETDGDESEGDESEEEEDSSTEDEAEETSQGGGCNASGAENPVSNASFLAMLMLLGFVRRRPKRLSRTAQ